MTPPPSHAAAAGLVVVGDALLDVNLTGRVERVCPDAPVPVVDLTEETVRAGGAGLAATFAAADLGEVRLVSALGEDEAGDRLRRALSTVEGLTVVAGRSGSATPVKARVRAAGQSLLRLDRSGVRSVGPEVTDEMLDAVASSEAILVSDYGQGLTGVPRLRSELARAARRVPVVWDPHPRGSPPVAGSRLVTPNLAEAAGFAGVQPDPALGSVGQLAAELRERWAAAGVVVTLGAGGALLDVGTVPVFVPASPATGSDPCGAGDHFAATAAARLLAGWTPDEAVRDAVAAAAAYLRGDRGGGGSEPRATAGRDDAHRRIAETRARGGTVVASGGCFDLLHAGHARTLAAAAALGDFLVVCVNSDRSVRRLKGPDRPIMPEAERVELLRSLGCVGAVVVFDEDTPEAVLDVLRPDVWVKGGDYLHGPTAEALPEAETVARWGGQVVVVPYHAGHTSSRLAHALATIS